jgi:hypothetical protein
MMRSIQARSTRVEPPEVQDLGTTVFSTERQECTTATRCGCPIPQLRIPASGYANTGRTGPLPFGRSLGLSHSRTTVEGTRAQNERGDASLGTLTKRSSAEKSELALQTRGGWNMEVFSPVAVEDGSLYVRPAAGLVSRSTGVPAAAHHCCEPSSPVEAVEIGKGS